MKFALFLVLCLAFAFVVESFEEEAVLEDEQGKESFEDEAVLEDVQGNDKHRLRGKMCKTDADCGQRECCFKVGGPLALCISKRGLFRRCDPKSACQKRCQDHLECRSERCLPR